MSGREGEEGEGGGDDRAAPLARDKSPDHVRARTIVARGADRT